MATRPKPDESQVFLTAEEMEAARQARNAIINAAGENEDSPEDRVKALLADLRADQNAKIRLYRRNGNNLSICQDYSLDDFESASFADIVRAKWGAGKYDVKLYGSKGVITAVTLMIQEPLNSNPLPQQNGGGELAQVLASMAEQQRAIVEILTREKAPAPAVDPMAQMTQMLTMLKLMKETTAASPPPAPSPIGEIVAAMRELRGAAKELIPGEAEDKEPSMMQLAGQIVPVLQSVLTQNRAPAEMPMPQIAVPESIAHAPNPIQEIPSQTQQQPQTPQTDDEEMNALQKIKLTALVQKLMQMAVENKPARDGADLILDKAPDEVIEFLDAPEWWEALAGAVPALVPHRVWLTSVRDLVVASLEDEPENPATPAP